MQAARLNTRDLVGGGIATAVGALSILEATHYPFGTLLRMGPGFFPTVLGWMMIGLGVLLMLQGLRPGTAVPPNVILLRPVVMILLGILAFAMLLERAGLGAATVALVLLSSLSEPVFRPLRALALAGGMLMLVYVIFIALLRLPIPLFAW